MTQPVHTAGPAQLPTGFESVHSDEHDGMPLFVHGDPFDAIAIVLPRAEANANARLLAAAYNAFDSAAKKLNLNAVKLAERMSDGGLAELVTALQGCLPHVHGHSTGDHMGRPWLQKSRAALVKVWGDAA